MFVPFFHFISIDYALLFHMIHRKGHTGIPGLWTQVLDGGLWTLDAGPWTLDSRRWTLDATLWTLSSEHWTLSLTVLEQNQKPVSDSA